MFQQIPEGENIQFFFQKVAFIHIDAFDVFNGRVQYVGWMADLFLTKIQTGIFLYGMECGEGNYEKLWMMNDKRIWEM